MLTNSVWGLGEIKEARKILRIFRASNSKGQSCNSLTQESPGMGSAWGDQVPHPPRVKFKIPPGLQEGKARACGHSGLQGGAEAWAVVVTLRSLAHRLCQRGPHTCVRDTGNSGDNLVWLRPRLLFSGLSWARGWGHMAGGAPWHVTALETRKRPCP